MKALVTSKCGVDARSIFTRELRRRALITAVCTSQPTRTTCFIGPHRTHCMHRCRAYHCRYRLCVYVYVLSTRVSWSKMVMNQNCMGLQIIFQEGEVLCGKARDFPICCRQALPQAGHWHQDFITESHRLAVWQQCGLLPHYFEHLLFMLFVFNPNLCQR